MKLMKKLLTILFAFMMVLTTTTMVFAEEGSSLTTPPTKGKITIDNAIIGETYQIYKILSLESFDTTNGRYAYTINETSGWAEFIRTGEGKNYFAEDENKYVTWKVDDTQAKHAEFAAKALEYARANAGLKKITSIQATTTTVEFTDLDLGYYLVDSGVGALCTLNTTNPNVTIQEKNVQPTITKTVSTAVDGTYNEKVSANVGDIVYFKTKITVGKGAQDYVLHDKMDEGLTFNYTVGGTTTVTVKNETKNNNVSYDIETDAPTLGDECTFHIKFSDYTQFDATDNIVIEYSATVNEKAIDKTEGVKNDTWLAYGSGHETTHDDAKVFTFNIPVYKFYKDGSTNTGLAGVTFKLYKDAECTDTGVIKLTQQTDKTVYHYDKASSNDTIKTETDGKFTVKGLAEGTYYLKEISTPNGFNLLKKPVEIVIGGDGKVQYKEKDSTGAYTSVGPTTENAVMIENKTGTLLPSTGGVGTTMMYIVGAALLIGSGVVLVTKKNAK